MADRFEVTIETTLKGKLARTLVLEAERRLVEPVELLADLVETILKDNLFAALLDD